MSTQQLLNGLSGNLQSSEQWEQQQALKLLRQILSRSMSSLNAEQRLDYVKLQRESLNALNAVEAENTAIIERFKTDGLAQLRARIGGQDPERILLHTRYLEKVEPPLPWEPRTGEAEHLPSSRRFRRAYDAWKYNAHVSSISLWDAACLNFEFSVGRPERGGNFIDASYITGDEQKPLNVSELITLVRELDLGGQLQSTLDAALGQQGKLRTLIQTSAQACLRFEALEAYRNRQATGLTLQMYEKLLHTIDDKDTPLAFDTLSMRLQAGTGVPLPLMLIKVASLGVVSYFPFRPGGALRYHTDANVAQADFLAQLKDSHRQDDLGWFARQLPITEMNEFKRLLSDEPRPQGLTVMAGFLYDTFHRLFPERTLDHLRFSLDIRVEPAPTLVQAFTYRQVQRYQANLATLATSRSARDQQAVTDGIAAIANEILQMLLTPVPGGVTGLNRVMQVAVFGSLTHSVISGVNEAAKGEAGTFASALADAADMAVSGLLISTAGRVHRRRMSSLLQQLGNPRAVTRGDGTQVLWKPDVGAYAMLNQNLLNGQVPNAHGTYLVNGSQYVWLKQDGHQRVVEVSHDALSMRFVLKQKNPANYTPPIVFDPTLQAWKLDLHNTHTLSDVELAERMLPNGSTAVPRAEMETLLRTTAPGRTVLDGIWTGQPAPVNLVEGVRRLQADQVIHQLIHEFHRRGHMPPHVDGIVLCMLPQLPGWPAEAVIHVHDHQGRLIERYGGTTVSPLAPHPINLKRWDDGTYSALDDTASAPAIQEQLFELIVNAQPEGSTLGREGSPNLSLAQRIARLRLQISELAQARRLALFSAMNRYNGYARHELPADAPARPFVPLQVASPLVEVTPLLQKLRERYAPLTPANLRQLLAVTPLDAAAQARFLGDGSLPAAVKENLEHHRTALRIDAVIDGLYHPRAFSEDIDQWAREFASSLVRKQLKRHFVITEWVADAPVKPYVSSGPDDTTVELHHFGQGNYEAYDMRNGGTIPVSPVSDSFYLAIGSVLQPHERLALGMQSASDANGFRKTLGDLMSAQRRPEGYVKLLDGSLAQYEQSLVLPRDLAPNAEGVYELDNQQLLPLYGSLYAITFDTKLFKWRLKHPRKVGVDTPLLEHNHHGAWRLASENPLTWSDFDLFYRLGQGSFNVDEPTAQRIMDITATPARALRRVHSAGLAPPPLLENTSKRFRIEREIVFFIDAMRTYSAHRNARPSLQLLLVTALPTWPDTHALEIIDSQGKVLNRYPSMSHHDSATIKIPEADSKGRDALKNIALNDSLTRALLGELPEKQAERRFKLAQKIAEHAHRERAQLFAILYEQSESGGTALERRFKAHFPGLPGSAVTAILEQASLEELKQLNERNQVGLRLGEQARLTTHDARLNHAYEGLYLQTLNNPDSDKIILHMLKSVPGWPADLRLDIHEKNATGRLLESAGHLNGGTRHVLARTDAGYQAYDGQGNLLNMPADATVNLIGALALVLSGEQLKALGVVDDMDLSPLQHRIAELALNRRVEIKQLLGLPHIAPWLQPPTTVDSSFIAYPFTLSQLWPFNRNRPVDPVSRVQELYPSFSVAQANQLLTSLGMNEPAQLLELERRQAEYRALDQSLSEWAERPQDADIDDPVGINLGRRRYLAQQMRQAWRQETFEVYRDGLFNTHTLILQLDDNALPDPDFIFGTRGFEHIEYLKISGNTFPSTGNAFLGKFSGLLHLKIDCMLNELPSQITDMTQLQRLDLADNNITLTTESRQRLGTLTQLRDLVLNGNPLGIPPDISAMPHLSNLELRNTGINQWPVGAESRTTLQALYLQENQLTTVPDALFTNDEMQATNRVTRLHDNPLSQQTLASIRDYRDRTGIALGGPLPGITHVDANARDVTAWQSGIAPERQAQNQRLWEQLERIDAPSPEDVFRVLGDLTQAYAYIKSDSSRQALTGRVWRLLDAMGDSTELRDRICLNTYVAGTCGDGALLTFINMEIEHKLYEARSKPSTDEAERELLALGNSMFYLRHLDQLVDAHLRSLRAQGKDPDDAEVLLYLRIRLRNEFKLPIQNEERLYSADEWVSENDIALVREQLRALGTTEARQASLLMEGFWIDYLARTWPEPFATIDNVSRYQLNVLNKEVADKRSDDYLERRQFIADLEINERNRLVRQLTQAVQLAQRAH